MAAERGELVEASSLLCSPSHGGDLAASTMRGPPLGR